MNPLQYKRLYTREKKVFGYKVVKVSQRRYFSKKRFYSPFTGTELFIGEVKELSYFPDEVHFNPSLIGMITLFERMEDAQQFLKLFSSYSGYSKGKGYEIYRIVEITGSGMISKFRLLGSDQITYAVSHIDKISKPYNEVWL